MSVFSTLSFNSCVVACKRKRPSKHSRSIQQQAVEHALLYGESGAYDHGGGFGRGLDQLRSGCVDAHLEAHGECGLSEPGLT